MDEAARADERISLRQWLKRCPGGRVEAEQALGIIQQLAAALHRAHIERPFHRDVIPSTVVVVTREDGSTRVEVPDLGAAAENHGEPGARCYLAPEQWWGARQNTATDQYALAVLFVELVTGRVPFATAFETEDESVMRTAVCDHPPRLPEDCPRREVLLRALAKDPRARFHSCSSFVAALCAPPTARRPDAEVAEEEPRPHHHHHAHHPRPRRRLPVGRLVVLAGLIGAGCWWGVRSGWFERMSGAQEAAHAKRVAALQKYRAQEAAAEAASREAQLAAIRAEIARQATVADQALKNLQAFLETGGAATLAVRRETLAGARRKAREDAAAVEKELQGMRGLEQALTGLKTHAVAYDMVKREIPQESEVALAYKALVEAAGGLKAMEGVLTARHPSVLAQRAAVQTALGRFNGAVERALKQMQTSLPLRESRLNELRAAVEKAERDYEAIEREHQVAGLKQAELERTRERESNRLADLRRREFEVQFGSGAAPTNTVRAVR
ncbi:MAG: protein kinase [Kiritimatiellia bacterium]